MVRSRPRVACTPLRGNATIIRGTEDAARSLGTIRLMGRSSFRLLWQSAAFAAVWSGLVRNTGWYIPFWRKPKRSPSEPPQAERGEKRRKPRARSDDELEHLRSDWVARYTRQVRALQVLGLSVGAPHEDVQLRYRELVAALADSPDDEQRRRLDEAYRALRVE